MAWMLCSACLRHYQRILGAPAPRMLAPSDDDDDDDGDGDCTGQKFISLLQMEKFEILEYISTWPK